MAHEQLITQRLEQLEAVMREHHLWQSTPPAEGRSRAANPFAWIRWSRCSGSSGC